VSNGKEALAVVARFKPQLLVTDWAMPQMGGVELCRTLRARQIGQSMHMLILTDQEDEEHLAQAFEAGADDYLMKPLQSRTLMARLRSAQRLLRIQDERERHVVQMRSLASELAVNNRRLQHTAMTDALTGLQNRRFAFEHLEQEWATAVRQGSALSCIVIDVDHFKTINDTYGHDAGDTVLRHLASVLRDTVRLPDAVCRIGGEEFLVICPNTALADAFKAAERVRAAVNSSVVKLNGVSVKCTVSLGAAAVDTTVGSANELFCKADQAVYRAKREGRNTTRLALAA
jgi:two-component system cell cycle response regulator